MTNQTNIHALTIINQAWNPAKGSFDYSFTFAFQGRDQYLAFRQLWKENYATLSRTTRNRKTDVKAIQRKQEHAGPFQSELHVLGKKATLQLLMLQGAKQESQRQYLAARQATP
jgi:hypothetical protein